MEVSWQYFTVLYHHWSSANWIPPPIDSSLEGKKRGGGRENNFGGRKLHFKAEFVLNNNSKATEVSELSPGREVAQEPRPCAHWINIPRKVGHRLSKMTYFEGGVYAA